MDADTRDVLIAIAFLYLASERARRALPLLLLVLANRPDDADCLRALAHAYTETGRGELALTVLDRLGIVEGGVPDHGSALLRSRAMRQQSRMDEARLAFREFVALRTRARA